MTGETILAAQFSHESNTFAKSRTDRENFRNGVEQYGQDLVDACRDTNTEVGGVVDVAERDDLNLVPSVAAEAEPGGRVAAGTYDHYADRIVSDAREHADDLDGVLLVLHGAMVPENGDDGEGPLIRAIRDEVGPEVPVVATLDLHANVTAAMLEADALVAYETYPHVDMRETGHRAMEILLCAVREEITPTMAVERPPVLAPGPNANTDDHPMADLEARAREFEERDAVLKVNVAPGFYRSDIPVAGFSVPVVTDDDPDLARDVAREMATTVWEERRGFVADHPRPAEAVAEAERLTEDGAIADGPVVLADVGDNPGGGAPGDETAVLRELLDQGVENAGVALVCDPAAVETLAADGVGETVALELGGKSADSWTDPVAIEGYVKAVTDGTYVNTGPMQTGAPVNLGRTVLVEVGDDRSTLGIDGNIRIVVVENRAQPWDAELWRHVGVLPERLDIVVVKSANHYRGDYEPLSSRVIPVDSPGLNCIDPAGLDHERIRRPVFPLDEVADAYPDW